MTTQNHDDSDLLGPDLRQAIEHHAAAVETATTTPRQRATADPACLSTWYPILERSGVPTPKTRIVAGPSDLVRLLDGEEPPGFKPLVATLQKAAATLGYPVFLRTGHTAAKHSWKRTCYVESAKVLGQHVVNLVEESGLLSLFGLPTTIWVVREFLDLAYTFRAFEDMPIAQERRYFIGDGRVLCHHAYWPPASIRNPDCRLWKPRLAALNEESTSEIQHLTALSEQVAAHFTGAWSLDWSLGQDGTWRATDMAPAARSYHWDGCPMAETIFRAEQQRRFT